MNRKTLERLRAATASREFKVKLVPCNGGKEKFVKIIAYTADLACYQAAKENEGFIGISARAIKIITKETGL